MRQRIVFAIVMLVPAPIACLADSGSPTGVAGARAVALEARERQAELDLTLGAVRLGLLKAQVRLARGRTDDAADVARMAMDAAGDLPDTPDRTALVAQLSTVIARARGNGSGASRAAAPLPANDLSMRASTTTSAPSAVGVEAARGDSLGRGIKVIDAITVLDVTARDATVQAFQDQALTRLGAPADIYGRVLVYPADWEAIRARRAARDDGIIYRGPNFVDADGETKFLAIYDIADLTADIPDFNNAPTLNLEEVLRYGADRAALRLSSEIFNGYAEDLAAGLPLLQYFGGVDESHRLPAGSDRNYDDLMRMVDQVIQSGK